MKNHRELKIWLRSHGLTLSLDHATKSLPRNEVFALTNQVRRASVSLPTRFAEGGGREGDAELKLFLAIALGSACELDYHVLLASDPGHLDDSASGCLAAEIVETRRMLGSFIPKPKAWRLQPIAYRCPPRVRIFPAGDRMRCG
ncbi:MAG TPA: four helix bundle protein [Opitutaceae bacterium]|nr:four helix bundle protein [Opitutaceae bacterium]